MKPTLVLVQGGGSPPADAAIALRPVPLTALPEVIENDASAWLLWDQVVLWRDLVGNAHARPGYTA